MAIKSTPQCQSYGAKKVSIRKMPNLWQNNVQLINQVPGQISAKEASTLLLLVDFDLEDW